MSVKGNCDHCGIEISVPRYAEDDFYCCAECQARDQEEVLVEAN